MRYYKKSKEELGNAAAFFSWGNYPGVYYNPDDPYSRGAVVKLHEKSHGLDYYAPQKNQKEIVDSWVREGTIPHILLSGSPGTG